MKTKILHLSLVAALGWMLAAGSAVAQNAAALATTNASGTISDFNPHAITVKSGGTGEAVQYLYTSATTYVDENGKPVSIELVKSGVPVIVYYTRDGGNLVASRIVVRSPLSTPGDTPSVDQTNQSTTTTTTTK